MMVSIDKKAQARKEQMINERLPIVHECKINKKIVTVKREPVEMTQGPCERIDGDKCFAYINPSAKWKLGDCGLATHIIQEEDEKKFINPIKASKRGYG
jgi:hypothetical protein